MSIDLLLCMYMYMYMHIEVLLHPLHYNVMLYITEFFVFVLNSVLRL